MDRRGFIGSALAATATAQGASKAATSDDNGRPQRILLIGLDPRKLGAAQPMLDPSLTPQMVMDGVRRDQQRMAQLGYQVVECTEGPEALDTLVRRTLQGATFDVVVIGAGIRLNPAYFALFERLINLTHGLAPGALIVFNTRPDDSTEAIQRWLPQT